MDGVGDGVEQMGLAQAGFAVDEEGIVALGRLVGHAPGCGVGKLVGGAHHKFVKGVLLRPGKENVVLGLGERFLFPLTQNLHVKIRGKKLPQRLLNGGAVAGDDDIPFEVGGGIQNKAVLIQREGLGVVEPGAQSGGGQVAFHQL